MTRLAIVGGRDFSDQALFNKTMLMWEESGVTEVVSGGARGADSMAESWARYHNIPIKVFLPEYDKYPGHLAPLMRNSQIVKYADQGIAFPGANGTRDTINKFKAAGKPCVIVRYQ